MGLSKRKGLEAMKMSIQEIANYVYENDLGVQKAMKILWEQFEMWGSKQYDDMTDFMEVYSDCMVTLLGIED